MTYGVDTVYVYGHTNLWYFYNMISHEMLKQIHIKQRALFLFYQKD